VAAFINNIYGGSVGAGALTSGLQGQLKGLLACGSAFPADDGVHTFAREAARLRSDCAMARRRLPTLRGCSAKAPLSAASSDGASPTDHPALRFRTSAEVTAKYG